MDDITPLDPLLTPIHLRKHLIDAGWSDRGISRALARGDLAKVRWGAYATKAAYDALDEGGRNGLRARAVVAQAGTELVISHVSALPFWGAPTWGFDLDAVHVTRRDRKAGRREAGVQQHRGRLLPGDTISRGGVIVSSPTRLAIEVTTTGRTEAALCVVNDLLHRKLTTREALEARYLALDDGLDAPMDHWPGTLTANIVLRLCDARLESVGESRLFHLCWVHGLPLPIPQYEVRDRHGRLIARVDFAWPELGVFMEFDGKIKYTKLLKPGESITEVVLREKRREQEVCEATGWRGIRVDWPDLERAQATAQRIAQVLAPPSLSA
ncbi:hypothetical protein QWJ41_09480 [Nocardioides sp. SOB44]|uniref:Transcriptional regulator, AbiEi antitoxin, Type IV TA system n=1 Tax=Nocardioides cremeus TaxID=3058044 RepID=A0ABT8TPS9_9ACTN|nr:hypothetical protein [Nocardioides cremeus]MDO3395947.1 hypothetical protein [Nocardioides cremeus]